MNVFQRMRDRADAGREAVAALIGAGFMGRGIARQVQITPGMRVGLIVNRNTDRAVDAFRSAGVDPGDVTVSDDPRALSEAIAAGRGAVTGELAALNAIDGVDVLVEITGAVAYGAEAAMCGIQRGLHVVMMNAETDALVGCALKARADAAGVVYTNSDGDQPGVLMRLIEFVGAAGFDIAAAINCKGFLDVHATPETIRPWAERQNTSLPMTTAFTDGTKMNIEQAVLCNATGLVPDRRGMHGISTSLEHALDDCLAVFEQTGIVDYTLGGDFGGGVFVIGRADDAEMVQPYMQYLKMGAGPYYLFFRPYHLCHLETPVTIAEAVLDGTATIAPLGRPVAEVVAVAKRDLHAGDVLDGIGGFTCYGEIDTAGHAAGALPIGLADGITVQHPVRQGEPIPLDAVQLDERDPLVRLWRSQHTTTSHADAA